MNSEQNNAIAGGSPKSLLVALGQKKLKLSLDCEKLQFVGSGPTTSEQEYALQQLNETLDEAVMLALNAACLRIQNAFGVEHGDFAGMHFASGGPQHNALRMCLATYLIDEAEQAKHEN